MPQTPKNPSDAPAHDTNLSHGDLVPFDTLSSVLSLVRMRCDVVCETQLRSPSGIDFPSGAAHFHAIETGTAMALCGDRPPVSVKSGDCVLFPRGEGHAIATTPDAPRTSLEEAVRAVTIARTTVSASATRGTGLGSFARAFTLKTCRA